MEKLTMHKTLEDLNSQLVKCISEKSSKIYIDADLAAVHPLHIGHSKSFRYAPVISVRFPEQTHQYIHNQVSEGPFIEYERLKSRILSLTLARGISEVLIPRFGAENLRIQDLPLDKIDELIKMYSSQTPAVFQARVA